MNKYIWCQHCGNDINEDVQSEHACLVGPRATPDSQRFSALSGPDGELIPDLMEGQHAPNPLTGETDYTRVSEEIEDMRASLNELVLSVAVIEKSIREFVSAYTKAMVAQDDREIMGTGTNIRPRMINQFGEEQEMDRW